MRRSCRTFRTASFGARGFTASPTTTARVEAAAGGTESWLALARAVGLSEEDVVSERDVAPGTRFAADAYVDFARTRPWLDAVASSLTEMFGPPVMARRVSAIVANYPWIDRAGLAYFDRRIKLAPEDVEQALAWVIEYAQDAGRTGALRRGAALQVRRAVGDPRRDGARQWRLRLIRCGGARVRARRSAAQRARRSARCCSFPRASCA